MASRRRGRGGAPEPDVAVDWVDSDEDSVSDTPGVGGAGGGVEDDGAEQETADQVRLRLAQQYLGTLRRMEEQAAEDVGAAAASGGTNPAGQQFVSHGGLPDTIESRIAARLQEDVRAHTGGLFADAAGVLRRHAGSISTENMRGHHLTTTCVALSPDDSTAFTGSKDCSVWQWDVETGKRRQLGGKRVTKADVSSAVGSSGRLRKALGSGSVALVAQAQHKLGLGDGGHTAQVLATAVTSDGRSLISGGRDKRLLVWDTRTGEVVKRLRAHGDAITALSFRKGTNTLFSASLDRTVKVWNMDNLTYMDTLYGHQTGVLDVDGGIKERAVSASSDRTVRLWKVPEESQLIFRGKTLDVSLDAVRMLTDSFYVSGSQAGTLALWNVNRKKPVVSVPYAHNGTLLAGVEGWEAAGAPSVQGVPRDAPGAADHSLCTWVTSLAVLRNSNIVASGSGDGYLRLWRVGVSDARQELAHVASLPQRGFLNGMAFASSGRFLAAAVGPEHRMGRWWRYKGVRHGLRLLQLPIEDVRSLPAHGAGDDDSATSSEEEELVDEGEVEEALQSVAERSSPAQPLAPDLQGMLQGVGGSEEEDGEGEEEEEEGDESEEDEEGEGEEEEGEESEESEEEEEGESEEEAEGASAPSAPLGGSKRTRRSTGASAVVATPSPPKRTRRSARLSSAKK